MAYGDRKNDRVQFERGIPVYMMAIDGTWRRECDMIDVSQTGAQLQIEGSLEGLDLKEFFLLLSSTGLAYRRCQLVRVDGDRLGIEFLRETTKGKRRIGQAKAIVG
jgi:PilZ domain